MAKILHFDVKGSDAEVRDLQERLNRLNPTRLPRLKPDGKYGVLTMARVMEFQSRNGLTVDGAAGPATLGKLPKTTSSNSSPLPPAGRCILVDLIHNKLTAFRDGHADLTGIPIHGGSATDPSTRGVFSVDPKRRLRHHTSSQFPEPPDNMQFSLFFNGGQAIHMGPPDEESHGCIHVGDPNAEKVFNWAASHDVMVIVVKLTR